MHQINLHQAKIQFSKYIEMVESGEIIIVCKRNVPVAEIRPIRSAGKREPVLGSARTAAKSTATPMLKELSGEDLRLWEGDEHDPLLKYAPKPKKTSKRRK